MESSREASPASSSRTLLLVTVAGAFVGLLLGKFALGLIFGFIAGLLLAAKQRPTAASGLGEKPSPAQPPAGG